MGKMDNKTRELLEKSLRIWKKCLLVDVDPDIVDLVRDIEGCLSRDSDKGKCVSGD